MRMHLLDFKGAKRLTEEKEGEMRKGAKESYGENAKAEKVSENVRGERLVFLF